MTKATQFWAVMVRDVASDNETIRRPFAFQDLAKSWARNEIQATGRKVVTTVYPVRVATAQEAWR